MPRWSGSDDSARGHAQHDRRLRGRDLPRLHHLDHRPGAAHVDPADALQPGTAGHRRLRRGGDRPVPERLPQVPAAGRRRGLRPGPEPDSGDHPAVHSPGGGRGAHRHVRSPRFNAAAIRGWRRALAICGVVVLLDQVSKAIVVSSLSVGEQERLGLGFSLTNTPNSGLAFGIGQGEGFVLAVTVVALALVLIWFAMDASRPGMWLAVGLLAGGALGNLADRVRMDAVTDFIDPPLWRTFIVADIAIAVGALALVLISLNPSRPADDAKPKPGPG